NTERKLRTVRLRDSLSLEPVLIPLTAEVLHRKKVRFPGAIVDMDGNARLELTEGIEERAIVTLRRDGCVGDMELALGKGRDEIFDLLAHEHGHGPFGLDLVGKQIRLACDHALKERVRLLPVELESRLDGAHNRRP